MSKPKAPTRQLAAKLSFAVLQILSEHSGELAAKELIEKVEQRVDLNDWARETLEKSGYVRWKSILHFFSIDLIKAGFLIKKQGVWYLTPEGEAALKLGEDGLLDEATALYRKWRLANPKTTVEKPDEESEESENILAPQAQEATIQQMEQAAIDGLRQQINRLNAYEFQDLVAALLRGMNYYTPFVAPKGKDGGVDVLAYQDPLGVVSPRVKVQIKHRESAASVQEVRELMGLLQKQGDVGMFVSSGGFTSDAKTTARASHVHVELIDLDRFIGLWQEFYNKLSDDDKVRLRLRPIFFYEPAL